MNVFEFELHRPKLFTSMITAIQERAPFGAPLAWVVTPKYENGIIFECVSETWGRLVCVHDVGGAFYEDFGPVWLWDDEFSPH